MSSPPPPAASSRRRVRWRLPLAAGLAVLAVALIASQTDRLEEALRRRIVRAAAEAGHAASLEGLELRWLPPQVDLTGLTLRRGPGPGPALLEVDHIEAVPSLGRLLRGRLAFRHVRVHGPRLSLPPPDPGAPAPGGSGGPHPTAGPGAIQVEVDRLAVRDGSLSFGGPPLPFSGQAGGLQLDAVIRRGSPRIPWRMVARMLRLEGSRPWSWEGGAEGRGALVGRRVEVERLRIRGGDLRLDLRGSAELAAAPAWRFEGEADLPAGWALRVSDQLPDLGGRLTLRGTARGEGKRFRAELALSSPRLQVATLVLEDLEGRATLEPGRIRLDDGRAGVLGGGLAVSYDARRGEGGWHHRAAAAPEGVDLVALLAALDLGQVPWNARLDGTVEATWRGTDLGTLRGEAGLTLRPGPSGQLRRHPLGGSVDLGLQGGRVRIHKAALRGEGATLDLQGRLGGGSTEMAFLAGIARPEPFVANYLRPLLARFAPRVSLPSLAPLTGGLQAEGRIRVDAGGTEAVAVVEGTDIAWAGSSLGRVDARVSLEDEQLEVEEARVEAPGHRLEGGFVLWLAGPARGRLEGQARFQAEDLDPWTRALAGQATPVTGRAEGEVRITRHACGLEGKVALEMDRARVLGTLDTSLQAAVDLTPGHVHLEDLRLSLGGGSLRGRGEVELGGPEPTLALTFAADGVRPEELLPARLALHLAGELSAEGSLRGPALEPEVTARIDYEAPAEAPRDLGDAELELEGRPAALRVRVRAPRHGLQAFGTLDGTGDLPVRLDLIGQSIDLALLGPLLGRAAEESPLRGQVDLNATVLGPLRRPGELRAEARVTRLHAELAGYTLTNREPFSVGWVDGVARLRPSHLVGEGTDLAIRGFVDAEGRIEAALEGTLNLNAVAALDPRLRLDGSVELDLAAETLGGDLVYGGRLELHDGRLGYTAFPATLTDVEAVAEFRGPKLTLTRLRGRLGQGAVEGSGAVDFEGMRPTGVDLELLGRDVELRYPRDLESVGDIRIRIHDRPGGLEVTGDAEVVRGVYRLPSTGGASILPARSRAAVGPGQQVGRGGGLGERIGLDVRISAPHSLYVRNEDVSVEAYGELQLGGTLSTPRLSGRIIALEGGIIRFRGVRYRVTGGFVDFAEYGEIDPLFHIEARTTVRDYEVTLEMEGRLSDFTFELSSYPPLTHEETLILLLTGRTPDEQAGQGGQLVGGEMAQVLSAPIGSGFARALGLTQVRIDPVDVNGNARLTLVKDVNKDLRVSFSDDFGSAGEQVYRIEYDITPKLELIASRDVDGGIGGDVRFTTRSYSYRRRAPEAADGRRLGTVELVDPLPLKREHLESRLGLKPGTPFRRARVVDAVDRLRAYLARRGYLAARVQVEEVERAGAVDLRFRVDGGTRYTLMLEGAFREKKLRRRLDDILGTFPGNVEETARRQILDYHRAQGFADARVVLEAEEAGPGRRRLRFRIVPGDRVKVETLTLRGMTALSDEELRSVMLTRPGDLLRRDVLDEDLRAVERLYREHGYQDARVAPAEIEIASSGRARVTVSVDEGSLWRIGEIRFEGNRAFESWDLLRRLDLAAGQPITRSALDAARTELRKRYDAAGFDEARVTYTVEGDEDDGRTVRYVIEEGNRHQVGSIDVRGNEHTRSKVIWRDLGLSRGDPLSRDKLLQAQRKLSRLGVFRSVEVRVEGEESADERPVVVEVREAPNVRISVGGGYDTEARAKGFFQIRNNNLWGRNQTLGAVLNASGIARRVRFSFLEPRLFGRPVEGLLTTAWSEEEEESFDEERRLLGIGITKHTGPYRYLFDYQLEDVDLSDVQLTEDLTEQRVSDVRLGSVGATVIRNLRDDLFNPREGFYYSMELRLFGEVLASQEDFAKFFGKASYHLPVTPRSTWAQGLRIGLSEPLGGSFVPISERFFAGGDSTIRGFPRDTVGPRDPVTDSPTGGQALFILNEEFRYPILGSVSGTVFLDVGNVYETIGDVDFGDLRWVLGAGLHLRTPIGPLRLEYGYKLDREPGESAGELFFSIGQAF